MQGFAYSRAGGKLRRVDLTDAAAVEAELRALAPSIVVHAAAERRPDVVETGEGATRLNGTPYLSLPRAWPQQCGLQSTRPRRLHG